jgi:hypothetical protein
MTKRNRASRHKRLKKLGIGASTVLGRRTSTSFTPSRRYQAGIIDAAQQCRSQQNDRHAFVAGFKARTLG